MEEGGPCCVDESVEEEEDCDVVGVEVVVVVDDGFGG